MEWFWWLLYITYTYYSSDTFFYIFFKSLIYTYNIYIYIKYIYIYILYIIYKWSYVIHDTQNPQEEVRYGVIYIERVQYIGRENKYNLSYTIIQ